MIIEKEKSGSACRTEVMGIVNVTPDSFFAESRRVTRDEVMKRVEQMLQDGASCIDVGGCSTRPGYTDITSQEELQRLSIAIPDIRRAYPNLLISVDTFRPDVAEYALKEWKVDIINDISGGCEAIYSVVARYKAKYVLTYNAQIAECASIEMFSFFRERIAALQSAGTPIENIILDPGYGFAKSVEQNYILMSQIEALKQFGCETLVGISRKSMIFKVLGNTPAEALNGTTVLNTVAAMQDATWLRVHDVKEAVQVVKIVNMIKQTR